ncbi:peptidoglycan DD-metalloendopeptidase family protein [Pseudomonas sp. A3.4]|nr:peptidoglycan DD-metalloendopeptidase family protein [Atopomonas sediminilitoris]
MRQGQRSHALLLAVLFSTLAACSAPPSKPVPVVDRNSSVAQRAPLTHGAYQVQRGDTLYSIAFRYGWDWKQLAQRNALPPPYTIYPGQVIRFDGQPAPLATRAPVTARTPSSTVSRPAPVATKPVQTTPSPVAKPAPVPAPRPAGTPPAMPSMSSGWQWPTSGTVVSRFGSNGSLNKGIDINGQLGQPVIAAADGAVVYAGSGLRGYGELIIIKHSDTFVSAYGHNRRLLVKEGQRVKSGQQIAEMGSTGTDQVKLHFEIRQNGKPVDPLKYLPRR